MWKIHLMFLCFFQINVINGECRLAAASSLKAMAPINGGPNNSYNHGVMATPSNNPLPPFSLPPYFPGPKESSNNANFQGKITIINFFWSSCSNWLDSCVILLPVMIFRTGSTPSAIKLECQYLTVGDSNLPIRVEHITKLLKVAFVRKISRIFTSPKSP